MFLALIRICFFICLLVGFLKVRKTSFRHVPTRRTRISRHYGETTVWVERLANALMDMLHSTATATATEVGAATASSRVSSAGAVPSTGFSTPTAERPTPSLAGAAWRASQPSHRHPRYDATTGLWEDELYTDREEERRSPHAGLAGLPFAEKLEERINAALEDSGIATWADFRIHAIGDSPPCIKAIHVVQGGQNSSTNNSSSAGSNSNNSNNNSNLNSGGGGDDGINNVAGGGNVGGQGSSTGIFSPSVPKSTTFVPGGSASSIGGVGGNNNGNPIDVDAALEYNRPNSVNGNAGGAAGLPGLRTSSSFYGAGNKLNQSIMGGATADANNNNSIINNSSIANCSSNNTPFDPTSLEIELEVEYTGSFDVTLKADLSFARGRQLPIYVHIGDLKYLRAHLRLLTKLQYESATMESPQKPYLQCTLFFESDPMFDMHIHTSLTRFNIQDFILIPFFAKFFLLRFIRKRMRRSNAQADAGVRFKIPLPEDVVDGGDQSWCAPLGRDTTSEETARASATPWFRGRSFQ